MFVNRSRIYCRGEKFTINLKMDDYLGIFSELIPSIRNERENEKVSNNAISKLRIKYQDDVDRWFRYRQSVTSRLDLGQLGGCPFAYSIHRIGRLKEDLKHQFPLPMI